MTEASPVAVTQQIPPRIVLMIGNRIFSTLLRSPLHRIVDGPFMLLHLIGRRSGTRYSIVVARHTVDGVMTVMTGAPWRLNAQGGAQVEVTCDGTTRPGHGVLIEDPEQVTKAYAGEIRRLGWKAAQGRLGLKITVRRAPTADELRAAVDRHHLSLIQITPHP